MNEMTEIHPGSLGLVLVAGAGGRVVSAVGTTTTILAVIGEEPFGYVRYDAQFRRALELQRAGGPIRILSRRQLSKLISQGSQDSDPPAIGAL